MENVQCSKINICMNILLLEFHNGEIKRLLIQQVWSYTVGELREQHWEHLILKFVSHNISSEEGINRYYYYITRKNNP